MKIQKKYYCTECNGDAYIAYTAKKKKDWGGLIKKGERLCISCGKKRLGKYSFF
jgi:hypothetical protein